MGLRWVTGLAVVIALAGGRSADAATPSFDCAAAGSAMERLICADGGLALLDETLAAGFTERKKGLPPAEAATLKQQQRDWLKQRNAACPLPAQRTLTAEDIWRSAPCVATQYRERLKALGKQDPTAQGTPPDLHPFCVAATFVNAEGTTAPAIPLQLCQSGNAHVPVTVRDGELAAEGTGDAPFGVWVSYKVVGVLPDGRSLVNVLYNQGGTGNFTTLVALRRQAGADGRIMLSGESVWPGGDRCNGGIDKAVLDQTGLTVTSLATPFQLMTAAGAKAMSSANPPPVMDCAICCLGTITERRNPAVGGAAARLVGLHVDASPDGMDLEKDEEPANRCFAKAVRSVARTLPHDFAPAEMGKVAEAFDACVTRGNR
ncbi:MAG TPA: lysozyme inhibitor LprI family protein [Magnetospirillum sp.]|nr:lysozyme inhibitor LprI family protein [Magnetospirillum sp.]